MKKPLRLCETTSKLMPAPDPARPFAVRESLRSLLMLMAVTLATLWLTTPAAAWNVHGATHIGSPVALDEHHHHDDAGQVSGEPAQGPADDQNHDRNKGGHDHMSSAAAALAATLDRLPVLPPTSRSTALLTGEAFAGLREIRPPPPARPPRAL